MSYEGSRWLGAGLAITCLALPQLASAAEKLNVKLGLWEITTVVETSGVPPLPKELLDKIPAEQRAKMLAELNRGGANGPHKEVNRECVTQKDLDKPFRMEAAQGCKGTLVTSTRTAQEIQMVCTGQVKGQGMFKVSAPTPTSMQGVFDMKSGDAFNIKGQMTGRWLGADCGEEADADDSDADAAETPED